jgi:hypothetical protein
MKRYPKKLRWFRELWRSLIQDKRNVSSNFWVLLSIKVSLCEWLQSFGQSEVKIIKWPFYKVLQSNDKRFVQSLLWNQTIRDLLIIWCLQDCLTQRKILRTNWVWVLCRYLKHKSRYAFRSTLQTVHWNFVKHYISCRLYFNFQLSTQFVIRCWQNKFW